MKHDSKPCDDLDKRTKAYKDCIKNQEKEDKGLGDTVEKITKATGVKAIVDKVSELTGLDCGCEGRKEWLNKVFPYKKNVKCLTQKQAEEYGAIREDINKRISPEHQTILTRLYNEVFSTTYKDVCSCNKALWRQFIRDLDKMYVAYKQINN